MFFLNIEYDGLPYVLPPAVHLEQVEGFILKSHFYTLCFIKRGLLHIAQSSGPYSINFWDLGLD